MAIDPEELAQIRFENALVLHDEFVRATVKVPEASPLRGLDGLFAERLRIQPSYWSQIKGRSRQIGERLARQFEQHCGKPNGWLDERHGPVSIRLLAGADAPRDDDERFVTGLVLSYYRRDPARARARLLELIGEALGTALDEPAPGAAAAPPPGGDPLWAKTRAAVAPLKRRR